MPDSNSFIEQKTWQSGLNKKMPIILHDKKFGDRVVQGLVNSEV